MFELKRVKITWGSTTFFPSHYTLRVAAHSRAYNKEVVASAVTMFVSNASSSAYLDIVKTQKREFPYDYSVPGYEAAVCQNEIGDTCAGCTEIVNLPRGWDASYVILNLSRYAGFGSTLGEPGVAYSVAEIEVQAGNFRVLYYVLQDIFLIVACVNCICMVLTPCALMFFFQHASAKCVRCLETQLAM